MSTLDLSTFPLFEHLDASDRAVLERIMVVGNQPAGHVFIREGERGSAMTSSMFLLLDGSVQVSAVAPGRGDVPFRTMQPGENLRARHVPRRRAPQRDLQGRHEGAHGQAQPRRVQRALPSAQRRARALPDGGGSAARVGHPTPRPDPERRGAGRRGRAGAELSPVGMGEPELRADLPDWPAPWLPWARGSWVGRGRSCSRP